MPLQINNLRFVGTGKPMKPNLTNLKMSREPSSKGVLQSGAESIREFQQINKTKVNPTPQDLGRYTNQIPRKMSSSTKVDLVI